MLCNKNDEFLLACAAVFVNLKCISIPASHCLPCKYSYIEFNTAEMVTPFDIFIPLVSLLLFAFTVLQSMSSHFTAFQVRALTELSKSQSSSVADRIDRIYSAANLVVARTKIRLFSRFGARTRARVRSYIFRARSPFVKSPSSRKIETEKERRICAQFASSTSFDASYHNSRKRGRYPINHLF